MIKENIRKRGLMRRYFLSKPIRTQMLIMVALVVLLQLVISGIIFSGLVADFLKTQIGDKALRIAETVAEIPSVRDALAHGRMDGSVQTLAENIRRKTGARYVVICDKNFIRYSHPNPANIGRKFRGSDALDVVRYGRSYVSESVGTLGPSLRGFAPVVYGGRVVGFVSVGYLKESVRNTIIEHQKKPLIFVFMMLATSLGAAVLVANYIKRVTLELEPAEISDLFMERTAILDSIRAGVIAVNADKQVRMVNRAAEKFLQTGGGSVGRSLDEIFPGGNADRVLASHEALDDMEIYVGGVALICSIMPVMYMSDVVGAVITFRRKDEIAMLSQELNKVREFSDMLRVQSHEYSNKLHTIAGLIQLEAYQEAQELILSETHIYEDMLSFVTANVPDPVVSALIMGKHNRARELKIDFSITNESRMADIPMHIDRKNIVTVLGNILDNAFDAVKYKDNKKVELHMSDAGNTLVFRVDDSGGGIDMDAAEEIFNKGFSTKGEGRGVGLYLVQKALIEMKGSVGFGKSHLGGAMFRVTIPKEQ